MCLLAIAFDAHPDYRLVLAGHRDEFHARPAAPLGWWHDRPGILAGRDLEAGGTWLGVTRDGRLAVVTNFRSPQSTRPGAPSRGGLIPDFLDAGTSARDFTSVLAARANDYSGFNLLAWDGGSLAYCTGGAGNEPGHAETLAPGVYGLSNARLDGAWSKVRRARERLRHLLMQPAPAPEAFFRALDDRQPAAEDELPDTGIGSELERRLSAPFIVTPDYGTRCTTLVMVRRDGDTQVVERRYGPDGRTEGRTCIAFHATRPAVAAR